MTKSKAIRVLIVDDHAVVRSGLHLLLDAEDDIEVVGEAGDVRSAVFEARDRKPDVVLMAMVMPGMSGIEGLPQVLKEAPAAKVLFLSMQDDPRYVREAFAAGASGYVLKESVSAEVVAALQAVHAGQRYLSPALRDAYAHASRGAARASPLDSLSARERQVLQLVVEGKSSAEIAGMVHLSPKTVETYRSRIMKKLGVRDVPALVKFALQQGLTPPG